MSGIVEFITGTKFENAKKDIKKEGQTAEDILTDITDIEELQKISDAILIDKNFLDLEEYNKLDRNNKKQLYRLGHLSKAKSVHAECDMNDLVKAMDAFNIGLNQNCDGGKKKKHGGGGDEPRPPSPPEESETESTATATLPPPPPESETEPESESETEPESTVPEESETVMVNPGDDVEKTFKEIGSKSAEITGLLRSNIENLNTNLSTKMHEFNNLTDMIKGKSVVCLQSLAMSLFGYELDKVASAAGTMALGAAIASMPSYPNEVGDIIFTVFKYSTLSVKYFIKLYITYIIGALAKSGLKSGTEQFNSFMGNAKHKLLQIATAASVDIAEVQNLLKEYIPTVITNEIKKQNMTELMTAVQKGLQESVEDRNRKISNVNFQTQKSFPEIPDQVKENITDVPTTVGELSAVSLDKMIETDGLDEDIKEGLVKKYEKITGKKRIKDDEESLLETDEQEQPPLKKRIGDHSPQEKISPSPQEKISGGKKQRTRKQKKQSKKQKKHSKNKSKKQKKNRTKKTRGKKH